MARMTVEAKAAVMLRRLRSLADAVEDSAPVLREVGDLLRKSTVSRFYSKQSPTGRTWKRTKRLRRGRGGRRGSTLVLTGRLRDSIEVKVSQGGVEVGTDVWYSRIHQFGGRLDARYRVRAKYRAQGIGRITANPQNIARLVRQASGPGAPAQAARKTLALLGGKKRAAKARKVRIPPRRFLGISKRDRKRTTELMTGRLKEALA